PYLTILSPNKTILGNAELQGHWTIPATGEEGERRFQAWLAKEVPSPGVTRTTGRKGVAPVAIDQYRRDDGKSGGGKPLALCLGDDPSATLISLCTHQPRRAILFYDGYTPLIVEKARQIRKWARRLPVETIDFVPTDHLGRGIRRWLSRENEEIRVDITPGTKAQSVALMTARCGEVWHLRNDLGAAKALLGTGRKPLAAPDLITQAWIMGEEIIEEGSDSANLAEVDQDMLGLLARFLDDWIKQLPKKEWNLRALRSMQLGPNRVEIEEGKISVYYNGEMKRGILPQTEGGYWFECLVENAFRQAGVEEMRRSLKIGWPWDRKQHPSKKFRAEIDLFGRIAHRFLIVSCKVGKTKGAYVREIEAVARIFGRFTIPILTQPKVNPKTVQESVAARGGVVRLGIREIAEPARFREILQKVFKARRLG
ncbi:MAG: hypothetical protein D6812_15750, partial [Deltaproteobacteria bacterium]